MCFCFNELTARAPHTNDFHDAIYVRFTSMRIAFVRDSTVIHVKTLGVSHGRFRARATLATLFNHMWPRIVAGIFIPVGNHYFQALASTLQFVAQVCDRLWLVPATDRAFAYITYMSPPHVALVCPPQCAATCGWTKWPVCSGP